MLEVLEALELDVGEADGLGRGAAVRSPPPSSPSPHTHIYYAKSRPRGAPPSRLGASWARRPEVEVKPAARSCRLAGGAPHHTRPQTRVGSHATRTALSAMCCWGRSAGAAMGRPLRPRSTGARARRPMAMDGAVRACAALGGGALHLPERCRGLHERTQPHVALLHGLTAENMEWASLSRAALGAAMPGPAGATRTE